MQDQLNKITTIIDWYETAEIQHLEALNKALKSLTSQLYHLEVERALYHDKYQNVIYNLTKENVSVARAENQANIEVPEMYLLRRIMSAAYRVADSIRTNISFGKTEYKHINTQV